MIPITNPAQLPKDHAYHPATEAEAKQALLDGATVYALHHVTLDYYDYFIVL